MLQMDKSLWVNHPEEPVRVNTRTGQVRSTKDDKPLAVYRQFQTGVILGYVPRFGVAGGHAAPYNRLVLNAVASPPREGRVLVVHRNSNKWDMTPANLLYLTRQHHMQAKVFEGTLLGKLNGPRALTLQKVVDDITEDMDISRVPDLDAIGSVFDVSASMVYKIIAGKAWGFIYHYMADVKPMYVQRKREEAQEAIRLYDGRDRALVARMNAA